MRSLEREEEQERLRFRGGARRAISVILVGAFGILLIIPPNLAYARPLPTVVGNRLGQYVSVSDMVKDSELLEEIKVTAVKEAIVSDYQHQGTFHKTPDARSIFIPSPVAVLRRKDFWIQMEKDPMMLVPFKLQVLALALINQNIRGLARLKVDEFTSNYLAAIGIELYDWMEDHGNEVDFIEIFKMRGPWILVFTPMSPTSMHEYMESLDLPSGVGDALGAHRLPTDMILWKRGEDLITTTLGAHGTNITFKINESNEVSVMNVDSSSFNRKQFP